jgi:hypothetical protein
VLTRTYNAARFVHQIVRMPSYGTSNSAGGMNVYAIAGNAAMQSIKSVAAKLVTLFIVFDFIT